MKHLLLKPSLFSLALCCSALLLNASQEQAPAPVEAQVRGPEEIVLRVGPVEVTQAELTGEINRLIPVNYFHAKVPESRQQELQAEAMQSLIEKNLIHLGAKRRNLKVTEKEVRIRFRETLDQVGAQYASISEKEFEKLLEAFQARVLRKLLIEKNEARFEGALAPITEEMLRERFAALEGQLMTPDSVRFRHILLKVDPAASASEAEGVFRKLLDIRNLLGLDQPFERLAERFSEDIYAQVGGDMGFVTKDKFVTPSLAEKAFELVDGETSKVLSSIFGYHLFKRIESIESTPLNFEEARAQLEELLALEQRSTERKRWLDSLKESFPVSVLIPEIKEKQDD